MASEYGRFLYLFIYNRDAFVTSGPEEPWRIEDRYYWSLVTGPSPRDLTRLGRRWIVKKSSALEVTHGAAVWDRVHEVTKMDARNSRAQMRFVIGEIADLEALEAIWDTTSTANIGKTGHAIADWVGAAWERVTGNYIIFREVLSCSWDLLMLTSLMILEERRAGGFFDCEDKWKKDNDIILTWDYLRGEWTESLLGGKERVM